MSTNPQTKAVTKRGRRTSRTPERAAILSEAIGLGVPVTAACRLAKISFTTFSAWREHDAGFREQLETAVAQGIESRLRIMAQAAQKDWRAALAWLEKCVPEFAKHRNEGNVTYTQNNNFVVPREVLDLIAQTRKQNEQPKAIEA